MPSTKVYHVSASQTIHKGPKATCVHCKAAARKKARSVKDTGSDGGKTSSNSRRNPPRKCGGCGKSIHRGNKSGLCLQCIRKKTKDGTYRRKPKVAPRLCSVCEKPISRINKTGLCRKCWNKSPKTKEGRQKVQAWVNAAVFNRNAMPSTRDSTDVP